MTYFTKEIKNGYNSYINANIDDMGTQMDVGLVILDAGESYTFNEPEKEAAALLFEGKVTYSWDGQSVRAERKNIFQGSEPWCLHVCRGTRFTLTAAAHSELYIQMTKNERVFPAKFYYPEDVQVQHAGSNGELMGCMQREIKTLFDYENAPYSNMVVGEVLNYPGKWSSYPPHYHPQPEVYFYRFDKPNGFGVGFANGEVYKTGHNGLAVINHGFHSQGAAPGYAMCYIWGIRHLDGNPWQKTRIDDPEHAWLWKPDANDHIFKG